MKDVILLDNQTNVNFFCNPDLVEDIRETEETLIMDSNTGRLVTNLKATLPGQGNVWFSPDGKTNTLSYALVEEDHDIDYDKNDKAFIVHLAKGKSAKFKNHGNGLYYYKPTEKYKALVAERKRIAGVDNPESEEHLAKLTGVENTKDSAKAVANDTKVDEESGDWTLVRRKKKTRNKMKAKHEGHGIVCPIDQPK